MKQTQLTLEDNTFIFFAEEHGFEVGDQVVLNRTTQTVLGILEENIEPESVPRLIR